MTVWLVAPAMKPVLSRYTILAFVYEGIRFKETNYFSYRGLTCRECVTNPPWYRAILTLPAPGAVVKEIVIF